MFLRVLDFVQFSEKEYDGATVLKSLAETIRVPVDQLNFFVCQLFALLFAAAFRQFLRPTKVSAKIRHGVSIALGIGMSYFCFGKNAILILLLPLIAYVILILVPGAAGVACCFCVAFSYLSIIHLRRVVFDYGNYTLDTTGPLMVMVMKLTSLFFNLHDGKRLAEGKDSLTQSQRKQALSQPPGLLAYLSYLLNFQSLLCGPVAPYLEYEEFIRGKTLVTVSHKRYPNNHVLKTCPSEEESVWPEVVHKIALSFLFALGVIIVQPLFPISHVKEAAFFARSFPSKIVYLILTTSAGRWKYYCAWLLGDAITNASGMGFAGYDPKSGEPKWNAISNVDIWGLEMSLTLRDALDSWNVNTKDWLRFVCYSRIPLFPTLSTYMLSALWHGFYPGYYITFASGALMTIASRTVRRSVRHFFLINPLIKSFYDFFTWLTCRLILAYITFPFLLLELEGSHRVYTSMLYWGHIAAFFIVLFFPFIFVQRRGINNAPEKAKNM